MEAGELTTGSVKFIGDHAYSDLVGGSHNDIFFSSSGPETFTGNGGNDKFVYDSFYDSNRIGSDRITDFSAGDIIKLPSIDGGYHIDATLANPGDVAVSYDSSSDRTLIDVNVNGQSGEDLMIYLDGNHLLRVVHDTHLIVA